MRERESRGRAGINNIFTDKPGSARHRDSLIQPGIPAHEDWQHKPSDNVFSLRTGRLAGGCSGNTVGRQQIISAVTPNSLWIRAASAWISCRDVLRR